MQADHSKRAGWGTGRGMRRGEKGGGMDEVGGIQRATVEEVEGEARKEWGGLWTPRGETGVQGGGQGESRPSSGDRWRPSE
jgi:hypothetical protein